VLNEELLDPVSCRRICDVCSWQFEAPPNLDRMVVSVPADVGALEQGIRRHRSSSPSLLSALP
jgi:hypothetical protein